MSIPRSVIAVIAFILGCVAAPLVVPPLTAQNRAAGAREWQVKCDSVRGGMVADLARDLSVTGSRWGTSGWEPFDVDGGIICFKRPL